MASAQLAWITTVRADGTPQHDEIFRVLNDAAASDDVIRLRLVKGKITLVHRRVWPALVRLADRIGPQALASVHEQHTSSGAHRLQVVASPDWVPAEVIDQAARLSEREAIAQLPAGVLPA